MMNERMYAAGQASIEGRVRTCGVMDERWAESGGRDECHSKYNGRVTGVLHPHDRDDKIRGWVLGDLSTKRSGRLAD